MSKNEDYYEDYDGYDANYDNQKRKKRDRAWFDIIQPTPIIVAIIGVIGVLFPFIPTDSTLGQTKYETAFCFFIGNHLMVKRKQTHSI